MAGGVKVTRGWHKVLWQLHLSNQASAMPAGLRHQILDEETGNNFRASTRILSIRPRQVGNGDEKISILPEISFLALAMKSDNLMAGGKSVRTFVLRHGIWLLSGT